MADVARRPRVLFVGRTRYRLPLEPGLKRKWDALSRQLDVKVLASAAAAEGAGDPRDPRFELLAPVRPARLDGAAFHLALPFRIARAIHRHRPDAIVAEDPHVAAAALLGRRLARRPHVPVVAEAHGNWRLGTRLYGSPARRLVAPVADAVDAWALRRADEVRALSPYTAGLVEEVRGARPVASFPTYSDLSAFADPPRRPLPERPAALFVGVLELYKNVDGLAAAWRRVARDVPEARLTLVGRGSRLGIVDTLARENPASVRYVPQLTPPELARALDESWLLVLPSRHEGLGRVVLESFARGRGVVASGAGGILDLVDDGVEGLLVDPEDVDGLVRSLRHVLTDRALAERLGAAAGRRFEDWRTTPEEFAQRVRELVDRALD